MNENVCQPFLKNKCKLGFACLSEHPSLCKDNLSQNNVVIVSKSCSKKGVMIVQNVSGLSSHLMFGLENLPDQYMALHEKGYGYVGMLDYLSKLGYKVSFVNTVVNTQYVQNIQSNKRSRSVTNETVMITHLTRF